MCGRYTLTADKATLQRTFNLDSVPPLTPRYNIAPTQPVPIITSDKPRELTIVNWGLIPSWSKDISGASMLINARGETVDEKPSFRSAFKYRRCLVPADGFYEWRKDGKSKLPQYIHFEDRRVFALAGLWERWNSPQGDEILSCTIVTTDPNALIKPWHHRMAVILEPEDYATWLDPQAPPDLLKSLLRPYKDDALTAYEVSAMVNNARMDDAEMIVPFTNPQQGSLI